MKAAAQAKDPRLACVREFIGTTDGTNVQGWNFVASGSGSRSKVGWHASGYSDDSHLWHLHTSFLREFSNDATAARGVAEVIAGVPAGTFTGLAPKPTPAPTPVVPVALPSRVNLTVVAQAMRIAGDGGDDGEALQLRLNHAGASLKVDGWLGTESRTAMARYQAVTFDAAPAWPAANYHTDADGIPGRESLTRLGFTEVTTSIDPVVPEVSIIRPAPVVEPPKPAPTKPYTIAATLDATGAGNWQGGVENRATGEWFVCEGKVIKDSAGKTVREDAIFYRFNKPQGPLVVEDSDDHMVFQGGGHQTSFGVSDTNVIWCADDGDIVTIKYRPGKTVTRSTATVMAVPVSGATRQISLSPTNEYCCIRRVKTDTEEYRRFAKDDQGNIGAQKGKTIIVNRRDDRVVQGFGIKADQLGILTGKSNSPSFVERYSFTTGALIDKTNVTDWGVNPGEFDLKVEVEGMCTLDRIGVKLGQGEARTLRVLDVAWANL
jgi:hypothetical protein